MDSERFDRIEGRLASVAQDVVGLRGEVGGLRGEVGDLRGEVGGLRGEVGDLRGEVGGLRGEVGDLRGEVGGLRGEVGGLRGEVGRLRVLYEDDLQTVKLLIEGYGARFEAIDKALAPLKDMYDLMRRVADDHEVRLTAVEKHTGLRDER